MTTTDQQTPTSTTPAGDTSSATTDQQNSTPSTSVSTDLGTTESSTSEASASSDSPTTDLGTLDESEGGDATSSEPPYKEFVGPPDEGKYEAFTLPDGAAADEELQNEFVPLAAELGLSQKGAQKLVDFKAKLDSIQLRRWGDHLSELKAAAQADPEIGGANYPKELGLAKKAIAKFGGAKLATVLNQYGVGAHAEMIRAWAKVGRAIGETPALNDGGGAGAVEKPLHELMYGAESVTKP